MKFIWNDGGRQLAGYAGETRDCVVRSIAIALRMPYQMVYDELFDLNKKNNRSLGHETPGRGNTKMNTVKEYLKTKGWVWVPTMFFGKGCQVHLKTDELPGGNIIVRLSGHLAAVVDGTLHDTHDCSRGGTRCVYGYFKEA